MSNRITGELLAHIKARRFDAIAKLFSPKVDFQAWTPAGHWVANDGVTAAQIMEVWFTPAGVCQVLFNEETSGVGGVANLECELAWHRPAPWGVPVRRPTGFAGSAAGVGNDADPLVMLRQLYLLTTRNGLITRARIYCPGLRNDSPDVDLQRQFRAAGIRGADGPSAKVTLPATS